MKKLLTLVGLLLAVPAAAQQDKVDPKLAVCRQIESERTGQVIDLAAQVQLLSQQMQELRAENAKLKSAETK